MANLKPPESQIPDAWSIKLTFSLIVTFYLTEPKKKELKNLKDSSYTIYLTYSTIFAKKF